ncbi:FAD/NAD(P)-binding domain-containing protein [Marasmius fiardii PR-910]|nr:FAD/NAD(P)-binding domain-containing protein [Marasmius fiardii PR-910]
MSNSASENAQPYGGRKAKERLRVLVVGCGLGGLATAYCLGQAGHSVTVFESSGSLGEIGAGIQVCPNMTRLLVRWGLGPILQEKSKLDKPSTFTYVRYDTGEQVGLAILGEKMVRDHGSPWYVVHRNDLYEMLLSIAMPFIDLKLRSKVKYVDPSTPSVTLDSGESFSGDLIVGADGIHSVVRQYVVGDRDIPLSIPLGDVAFRTLIPTEPMLRDPDLRDLVENPRLTCWMGPGRHVIGYCVRGRSQYNMVIVKPDDGSTYSWTAKGEVKEIEQGFPGWEPRFKKLVSLMPSVLKSKLLICLPLKSWTHDAGRVTLLGDACHPMLPYRAQGAAMAIEDAAVLGNLFSRISHKSQIPTLLKAYQSIRFDRATSMQKGSLDNRTLYHLVDGPEQEARDLSFRAAMKQSGQNGDSTSINPWADRAKLAANFSYDVDQVVDQWWELQGTGIRSNL